MSSGTTQVEVHLDPCTLPVGSYCIRRDLIVVQQIGDASHLYIVHKGNIPKHFRVEDPPVHRTIVSVEIKE